MVQSAKVPGLPSPFVALAFLGTGFFLAVLFLAAFACLAFGKRAWARRLGLVWLAGVAAYSAALLAASLSSRERVLPRGGRKYFCEMDCHLAYSVESAGRAADGRLTSVTVKTWFDERTIAPWRGDARLDPNPRVVYALDQSGRRYEPVASPSAALSRPLRPGESYTTTVSFDVPSSAKELRLFLGDPPGLENFLIDHENSPLHGKVYFALS